MVFVHHCIGLALIETITLELHISISMAANERLPKEICVCVSFCLFKILFIYFQWFIHFTPLEGSFYIWKKWKILLQLSRLFLLRAIVIYLRAAAACVYAYECICKPEFLFSLKSIQLSIPINAFCRTENMYSICIW